MNQDNIKPFTKEKVRSYPVEDELLNRVYDIFDEYDGAISNVSVIGILELAKVRYQ